MTETVDKKIKTEVLDNKVKIEVDDKTYIVRKPNTKQEIESDKVAAKLFAQLVNDREDGSPTVIPRSRLEDYMVETGIWTQDQQDELKTSMEKVREKELVLKRGGIKRSKAKEVALEIGKERTNIYKLILQRQQLDSLTLEGQIENMKSDYLATQCILTDEGNPVFNSVDEYRLTDQEWVFEAKKQLDKLLGNDPDFYKELPENKFLKEYGFVNEDYELIEDIKEEEPEEEVEFQPFLDD